MAQSPFQTSGNVADIAPVALTGGFTPSTGIADVIQTAANVAIPLIQKNHTDNITDAINVQAGAVSLALKATRFPSIKDSVFSEEALANPNVALALKEYTLIQDAAKQGRLPSNFVLERLELAQNEAIRNAPEFEDEIRGAMRDATGQDPKKALFSRMLQETTTKTVQQKAQEQLEIQAIKIGTTVEQVIGMNQTAARSEMESQRLDLLAKQGKYTLNTLGSHVVNRGSTLVSAVMTNVLALTKDGGSIDTDTQNVLEQQTMAAFNATIESLLAKTTGLNVSGAEIQAEIAPLITQRDTTLKMIKDGTMTKLLNQNSNELVADAQNTFRNNPEYGSLYNVMGADMMLKFVEFKAKFESTPAGAKLAKLFNKKLAQIDNINTILQQGSLIGDGAELETQADKQARIVSSIGVLSINVDSNEEFQLAALADIQKYGGEDLAWSTFANNDVLTATATSNKLKAAFINMQVATTAGLGQELVELASVQGVDLARLNLNSEGELIRTALPAGETIFQSSISREADAQMGEFIKRYNRANVISANASLRGIIPSARYSGSQDYWNTVSATAREIVKPKDTANVKRKVIKGADGKLTFSTGG